MGRAVQALAVAFASALVAVGAQADSTRPLNVDNATRTAMVGFTWRVAGTPAWQEDALASKHLTLGIQKRITLSVPAGAPCHFDYRAQFEDGRTMEKKAVDACNTGVIRITDY
jgi:hypothetical protein